MKTFKQHIKEGEGIGTHDRLIEDGSMGAQCSTMF